ncbi:HYC_CC_PP family protein [Dyadobacter bucti]|uniref:HYC_CC_PP family protein n=1 Tax=Dyadobacter bucti TaxID=2572203 RepID=UPI0011086C76|nr:hypothetical protein [Dyadobacter bucti]
MKKLIILFLAFLYLGTATGVTLTLHYCMGEVVNWKTTKADADHCENCGMDKGQSTKKGCCKDEFKKIKTDDSGKLVEAAFSTTIVSAALPVSGFSYQFTAGSYPSISEKHPRSNAPPRSKPVPVYVLNCTYLI